MISDEGRIGNVLIKDDRIEKIDYTQREKVPETTIIYPLKGKYLIPGLIDNHVHITHGTLAEAREHLEKALKGGITGVRDIDARMLSLLKRNNLIGEYLGPDVFYATIIAGSFFFENDPRPQQVAKGAKAGEVPWQRAISKETDFPKTIAEIVGIGATAIKIYARVDKELLNMVTQEAKKQGLKVWAHASIPPTRPSDVVEAKVDVVSHAGAFIGYELTGDLRDRYQFKDRRKLAEYRKKVQTIPWDSETPEVKKLFEMMVANNTILDATLYVYYFGLNDPERLAYNKRNNVSNDDSAFKAGLKSTKAAYEAGVKIGAGTDHMISTDGRTIHIHKEIELLVEAGLSNIDALRAATIINAEGLGEEKEIGSIEEGKIANLVILGRNPLEDIRGTRSIEGVIKRGKMIQN